MQMLHSGVYPTNIQDTLSTYSVTSYGAVGNGSDDDSTPIQNAIDAAYAAGGGVVYFPDLPSGDYYNVLTQLTLKSGVSLVGGGSVPEIRLDAESEDDAVFDASAVADVNVTSLFVATGYTNGAVRSPYDSMGVWQHSALQDFHERGLVSSANTSNLPVVSYAKTSDTDSGADNEVNQGIYVAIRQVAGDAGFIPITGYALVDGTATGAGIGGQFRSRIATDGGEGWGGWSYVDMPNTGGGVPDRVIGWEANVRNNTGVATSWMKDTGTGAIDGFVSAPADSTDPGTGHHAYRASKNTGGGWHTGYQVGTEAILPLDGSGNNEAALYLGAAASDDRYGGLRYEDHFDYAIRTLGATLNKGIGEFADDQYFAWGGDATTSGTNRIRFDSSNDFIVTSNGSEIFSVGGSGGEFIRTSAGATSSVLGLVNSSSAANTGVAFNFAMSATTIGITAVRSNSPGNGAAYMSFRTHNGTSTAERVRIEESGNLLLTQGINAVNLPTSDPAVAGQFWNDSGTLKVSAG